MTLEGVQQAMRQVVTAKMATVESTPSDFVISSQADHLLSSVSGDFADVVLGLASKIAAKDEDGTPVVTANEIKVVLGAICEALTEGLDKGDVSVELRPHVQKLRTFCDGIEPERKPK